MPKPCAPPAKTCSSTGLPALCQASYSLPTEIGPSSVSSSAIARNSGGASGGTGVAVSIARVDAGHEIGLALGVVLHRGTDRNAAPRKKPRSARAEQVVTSEKVPVSIYVYIDCANGGAGEDVFLTGDLHVVSVVVLNGAGGVALQSHFQPMGVSGVGSTGTKYQATGVTRDTFTAAAESMPFTETYVNNFRIIGAGPDNNYLVHETFHVTVDAERNVSTFVDNFTAECK